jgi:hypothetical protein
MNEPIQACLARLAPHLDLPRVAVTGGFAIDLSLGSARRNPRPPGQPARDLDLVAESADAVFASAVDEFLVSHFHLPQPSYPKFLVQLVCPATGVRVDVFPDALNLIPRTRPRAVAGLDMRVLEPCSLLEHKLTLLAGASTDDRVDEKHYADVVLLAGHCGRPVPAVPASMLGQPQYHRELDTLCSRCDASRHPDFPLAEKRRILAILGYV